MTDHAQQDAAAGESAAADQAADAACLREALAAAAHTAWSGWMAYLFGRTVNLANQLTAARFTIDPSDAERWKRQMRTPYAALSEAEKESDRAEADKILAVLTRHHGYAQGYTAGYQRGLSAAGDQAAAALASAGLQKITPGEPYIVAIGQALSRESLERLLALLRDALGAETVRRVVVLSGAAVFPMSAADQAAVQKTAARFRTSAGDTAAREATGSDGG